MSTIKNISTEFGEEYSITRVLMSDGKEVTVVATLDSNAVPTWVVESNTGDSNLEGFVLRVVQASMYAVLEITVGDDDDSNT
jgi:hypothetical protein